jgi:hypothetical protein
MFRALLKLSFIALLVFITLGCQSEVNNPGDRIDEETELYKFQTLENDLELLNKGGMQIPEGDGVFSIGWNEIFRPFNDDSQIKGMSFAVAFGDRNTESLHFPRFGIDMGTIMINYASNQIEMHKFFHPRRGTAYSLFNRPFGASELLLDYIPDTEYTFNISGSENFPSGQLTLTSPVSLIDITSHTHGDTFNPNQDLHLTWEGGNTDGKIAIQFLVHLRFQGAGNNHPAPKVKHIIVEILENNPGEYTIPSERLRRLLSVTGAERIVIGVSQFDLGETELNGKLIHTAMRNGTSVMLVVE